MNAEKAERKQRGIGGRKAAKKFRQGRRLAQRLGLLGPTFSGATAVEAGVLDAPHVIELRDSDFPSYTAPSSLGLKIAQDMLTIPPPRDMLVAASSQEQRAKALEAIARLRLAAGLPADAVEPNNEVTPQ